MKIQCQSCQAKYTIADEKVLGKVVKIRCKKCSATIVINGNEQRPAEDNADTHVFDYAAGQSNDQWTVNVADGDQRTMTASEIAAEYRAGTINEETYCWKDGMADWLPLREIEQLYAPLQLGPQPSLHDALPQSVPPPASGGSPLFSANEVASAVDSPFAGHTNGNGAAGIGMDAGGGMGGSPGYYDAGAEAAQAAPAAARRGGGRGQGADLFGNAATAGGEDDVMTSAATGMMGGGMAAGAAAEEQKLTGQRNESSVLFSLSALTSNTKEEPVNRTTAAADGSGLIDIRALSQTMGADDKKKDSNARVDDIMNLSGGGAFGAALAAPILAPPPLEMASAGATGDSKPNKTLLIAILGGAALIAVGIIVAVMLLRPSTETAKDDSDTTEDTAPSASSSASGDDKLATADPTEDKAASAATKDEGEDDKTPAAPGTGEAPSHATSHHTRRTTRHHTTTPSTTKAEPKPATRRKSTPKDLGAALAQAAGKPAHEKSHSSSGGGSTAPFNRGAASSALSRVNVQSCKRAGGPTGAGHVTITFAPSGSVKTATVDRGPFPGTSTGGCIAGKYRGAHIPAFSGGPVRVGKSFSIH